MPARARLWLALVTAGLIGVFSVAAWLRPYDAEGNALLMRTHTQLGLEPCNFEKTTGKPCPSCGMTTSFALLIRGDVVNSLRANWVGTLAAAVGLVLIPFFVISLWRGKHVGVRPTERTVLLAFGGFMVLMVIRWGALILMPYLTG
jgi:hypothetical protein